MAEVIQVTAPESEPVTLAEAKAQALYESDDQDDTLNLMIAAARRKAEEYLSAQLIHAIWELYLDKFPETIYLPRPPAVSISQITYIDSNGDEQTLDASAYRFTKGSPARIVPVYATTWPTARNTTHAVTVRYVCGYGLTGSATPPTVKQGILALIAHYFEHRDIDAPVPRQIYDAWETEKDHNDALRMNEAQGA